MGFRDMRCSCAHITVVFPSGPVNPIIGPTLFAIWNPSDLGGVYWFVSILFHELQRTRPSGAPLTFSTSKIISLNPIAVLAVGTSDVFAIREFRRKF